MMGPPIPDQTSALQSNANPNANPLALFQFIRAMFGNSPQGPPSTGGGISKLSPNDIQLPQGQPHTPPHSGTPGGGYGGAWAQPSADGPLTSKERDMLEASRLRHTREQEHITRFQQTQADTKKRAADRQAETSRIVTQKRGAPEKTKAPTKTSVPTQIPNLSPSMSVPPRTNYPNLPLDRPMAPQDVLAHTLVYG